MDNKKENLRMSCTYSLRYVTNIFRGVADLVRRFIRKFYIPGDIKGVDILPLTPICSASDIAPYANRMRLAMESPQISNIAITGRFGAGKSSFLRTYFKDAKVLWISLAPFINTLPKLSGDGSLKNKERLGRKLEASVLQQMFYTASAKELPFSRFLRIKSNGLLVYLFVSLSVLCSLIALILIFQPAKLWNHIGELFAFRNEYLFATGVALSVVPIVAVSMLVCDLVLKTRIFAKVHAFCTEVELRKHDADLAFNRALDEVIYHFQQVHYEAVIFEDLDRFPDTIIFTKLKEVNQLVNASRDIKRLRKPIKFIFAVRDTLLSDVERVKFFDYILPILPSMSSANSYELFIECAERVIGKDLQKDVISMIRTVSPHS